MMVNMNIMVMMVMVVMVVGQPQQAAVRGTVDAQSQPYYHSAYYTSDGTTSLPPTGFRPSGADLVNGFDDPTDGIDGIPSLEQLSQRPLSPGLSSSLPVTVPYDSEEATFGLTSPLKPFIEDPAVFAPDLSIDTRPEVVDWSIDTMWVNASSCAVQEGCVLPGLRKLLRFNTRINNFGTADFVVGNPYHDVNSTFFHYHQCHRHFHWPHVLDCSLLDQSGNIAARGMKIGFCLEDFFPARWPMLPLGKSRFDCVHQGISEGWADQYHKNLDCQWIDVTDVPPGQYKLVITVNAQKTFHELNYDNNRAEIPITVATADVPMGTAVNDQCPGAIDVVFNQHLIVNTKGTTDDGMKCDSISEPKSSVWFKVRGTGHRLLASTCNPDTTVDSVVMIYRDCTNGQQLCAAGSAMCIAANDDADCGAAAYVHWCSEPNVDYFIVVGGIDEAYGTIDLTVMVIDDSFESLFFAKPPVNPSEPCSGPMVTCGTDESQPSTTATSAAAAGTQAITNGGNMYGMYPAVNGMCPATPVVNLNFADLLQAQQLQQSMSGYHTQTNGNMIGNNGQAMATSAAPVSPPTVAATAMPSSSMSSQPTSTSGTSYNNAAAITSTNRMNSNNGANVNADGNAYNGLDQFSQQQVQLQQAIRNEQATHNTYNANPFAWVRRN